MKKRNLKKLSLNKNSISKIQEKMLNGGDVSLPNPATAFLCDMTGANFCLSWQACNTRLDNVTCLFTVGPGTPQLTDDCLVTQLGC